MKTADILGPNVLTAQLYRETCKDAAVLSTLVDAVVRNIRIPEGANVKTINQATQIIDDATVLQTRLGSYFNEQRQMAKALDPEIQI